MSDATAASESVGSGVSNVVGTLTRLLPYVVYLIPIAIFIALLYFWLEWDVQCDKACNCTTPSATDPQKRVPSTIATLTCKASEAGDKVLAGVSRGLDAINWLLDHPLIDAIIGGVALLLFALAQGGVFYRSFWSRHGHVPQLPVRGARAE